MTQPIEPTEPDLRVGEMDEDEAEALLRHSLQTVNRMRQQLGLSPLEWAEEIRPAT